MLYPCDCNTEFTEETCDVLTGVRAAERSQGTVTIFGSNVTHALPTSLGTFFLSFLQALRFFS